MQPLLKTPDPVPAETPPPAEPNPDDMTLATPLPHPSTRPPSRQTSPSSLARTAHPVSNGPATGATGRPIGSRSGAVLVHWHTPKPVYPASLRLAHVQGSGSVRVTTDGTGRVISAVIGQSTGNALLDDHTCRAAQTDWTGPPNATVSVPITYQLD